jgi:hypothetical protein
MTLENLEISETWPRWMRAETAAAYVDEPNARAFRRKVGAVYPPPTVGKGKGAKWDRLEIDKACRRKMPTTTVVDAASVL